MDSGEEDDGVKPFFFFFFFFWGGGRGMSVPPYSGPSYSEFRVNW